jgi:hypothetical protein
LYSLCLTPSGLPIVATFPRLLAISRSAAVARSMSSVSLLLAPLWSLWSSFVGVRRRGEDRGKTARGMTSAQSTITSSV